MATTSLQLVRDEARRLGHSLGQFDRPVGDQGNTWVATCSKCGARVEVRHYHRVVGLMRRCGGGFVTSE